MRRATIIICRTAVAMLILGSVAAVTGCAIAADVEELTVTQSEYRSAFDEFAACMSAEGYGVIIHDDSGTVIDYSIPGDAVTSGIEDVCYEPFMPIDAAWQVANEDTSEFALAVRECLEELGFESDGTSAGDWQIIQDNGLESTCGNP